MRGSEHDQLWNQIEAEIHLHRHKTVIRACRGRKDPNNKTPAPPPPQPEAIEEEEDAESKARKRRGIGEPRTVVIHKDKTEGLGISITVIVGSFSVLLITGLHLNVYFSLFFLKEYYINVLMHINACTAIRNRQ